jgi:gas vesicle protein
MNVLGHIIQSEKIFGISPLQWHEDEQAQATNVHYSFIVYTSLYAVEIKSQVCTCFNNLSTEDQETLRSFRIAYTKAKRKICALLNEVEEIIDHMQLVKATTDQVQEQSSNLLKQLSSLRTKNKEDLLSNYHQLNQHITNLKTLAVL